MKITVEVDCTPVEARQFLGLPDVAPMQAAVMAQLERKMLSDIDKFSPEAMIKSWMSLVPQNAEWLQDFFRRSTGQG